MSSILYKSVQMSVIEFSRVMWNTEKSYNWQYYEGKHE